MSAVAAGLRCTLANHAYTARELAFQYADSGAALVFTSEAGVGAVRAALGSQGFSAADADARIVVLRAGLEWAGGPTAPRAADSAGLLSVADFLGRGQLEEEERFEEPGMAGETVYLCYSSGTTGKPKGVEVSPLSFNACSSELIHEFYFIETTHRNITSVLSMITSVVPMDARKDIMLGFLPLYHIYGEIAPCFFFREFFAN